MSKFDDNYFFISNIREHIELQNEVKTKGILMHKNRYAILTRERLMIFESKEKFLMKKNPRKNFFVSDHQFIVNGKTLGVWKATGTGNEIKLIKNIYFPSSDICIHWWESIRYLKYQKSQDQPEEKQTKHTDTRSNIFSTNRLKKSLNEHSIFNSSFSLLNHAESKTNLTSSSSLSNSNAYFHINSIHSRDSFSYLKLSFRSSSAVPVQVKKNCEDNKNQERQIEKENIKPQCQASLQSKTTVEQENPIKDVKFFNPRIEFYERNLLEKFNFSRNPCRNLNNKKNLKAHNSVTYQQIISTQQEESKKVIARMFDNDCFLKMKNSLSQQHVKDIKILGNSEITFEEIKKKETILGSIEQSIEIEVEKKTDSLKQSKNLNKYPTEDFSILSFYQRRSLIENIVENCYTLRILKMIVAEKRPNSNLIPQIFGVLSKILSGTEKNINDYVTICEKLPNILTKRLSKLDRNIFSTLKKTHRISREVMKMIYSDMNDLVQILRYFALKKTTQKMQLQFSNKEKLFCVEMKCLQALICLQIIKRK